MTFSSSLLVRRLIASTLYLCSATFFITNLAVTGAAGFGAIDLFLVIGGIVTWVLAGAQSVYLRSVALAKKDDQRIKPFIRPSTHSTINAALYTASAVFFVAGDAYNANTTLMIRAPRLAGSSLWLLSSLTYLWLAWAHERKQEDQPNLEIKPAGIDSSIFHFACESEYLAAGILYSAAIWLANPVPGFKAAGNICWLIASTHETIRTFQALPSIKVEEVQSDIELGGVETTAPAPK